MGTKWIDGELRVSDSIFEGDVSLASKYAKDSNVVHKTGDDWGITGTKQWDGNHYFQKGTTFNANTTFNGVNTFNGNSQFKYVRIDNNWDSYGEINSKKAIQNHGIILKGTIDLHPEGDPVIFPYYMNDLAYLIEKGGNCIIRRQKEDTGEWVTVPEIDIKSLFNGTSSYTGYKVDNLNDKLVILIKSHAKFSFNTRVGLSSGSAHWRAKDIQIDMGYLSDLSSFDSMIDTLLTADAEESLNNGNVTTTKTWVTRARTTDYAYGTYFATCNGPMIGDAPSWNIIRITLTNFNNTRSESDIAAGKQNNNRFAGIFALNYGSEGLNTTLLGRKGGDLYGTLSPYKTDTCDLGGSSKRWNTVYGRDIRGHDMHATNGIFPDTADTGMLGWAGCRWNSASIKEIGSYKVVPSENENGYLGESARRWNTIYSKYLNADYVAANQFTEGNIPLYQKYAQETTFDLPSTKDTYDDTTIRTIPFFTITLNKEYSTFGFELLVRDREAGRDFGRFIIQGRQQASNSSGNSNIWCKILKAYSRESNISVFGIKDGYNLTLYLSTKYTWVTPRLSIQSFYKGDGLVHEFLTNSTWTAGELTPTYSEEYAMDHRYIPKNNTVTLSTEQTIYGIKTFTGSNIFTNETKFTNGGISWSDIANGIAKSSCFTRGAFMETIAGQIIAPNKAYSDETTGYNTEANKIKFQKIDSITSNHHPITSDMAVLTPEGLYVTGQVYSNGSSVVTDSTLNTELTSIRNSIAAIDQFQYYVSTVASDTPKDVEWRNDALITIKGTLVASESTEFTIFLVPNNMSGEIGGSYVEYLTIKKGNTYTWERIGTTATDLTNYISTSNVVSSISGTGTNPNIPTVGAVTGYVSGGFSENIHTHTITPTSEQLKVVSSAGSAPSLTTTDHTVLTEATFTAGTTPISVSFTDGVLTITTGTAPTFSSSDTTVKGVNTWSAGSATTTTTKTIVTGVTITGTPNT